MRNIWPNYFHKINQKVVKKRWKKIGDNSEKRDLSDITVLRMVSVSDKDNQTEDYYEKAYSRLHAIHYRRRAPLPYHFVIDTGGRIIQHRGIDRIVSEPNEIVIGLVKGKDYLNKREAHAVKSIVKFFQEDIKNVFWDKPTWAKYAITSREKADEFERLWEDTIPKTGEVSLEDLKSILKLIFLKK